MLRSAWAAGGAVEICVFSSEGAKGHDTLRNTSADGSRSVHDASATQARLHRPEAG